MSHELCLLCRIPVGALPPPQGSLAQALTHLSDFESTTPKEELVEQLVADPVGWASRRQGRIGTGTLCTAACAPQLHSFARADAASAPAWCLSRTDKHRTLTAPLETTDTALHAPTSGTHIHHHLVPPQPVCTQLAPPCGTSCPSTTQTTGVHGPGGVTGPTTLTPHCMPRLPLRTQLAPSLWDFVSAYDADYERYVTLVALLEQQKDLDEQAAAAAGGRAAAAAAPAPTLLSASDAAELLQLGRYYSEHLQRDLKVGRGERERHGGVRVEGLAGKRLRGLRTASIPHRHLHFDVRHGGGCTERVVRRRRRWLSAWRSARPPVRRRWRSGWRGACGWA